jgi:hypothetical protein
MFSISPVVGDFRQVIHQQSAVPNTWTRLVTANPDRAILYLNNATNTTQIYFSTPPYLTVGNGLFQVNAGTNLVFTWSLDGPMSTLEWWYFFPSVSANYIVAIEWIWHP